MRKTPPVIHPFMVTSLFVLVSYREVQPFVRWEELIGMWLLALGVTYAVFRGFKHFVTEPYKAALLTTVVIVAFCFYGDMESRLKNLAATFVPSLARSRYVSAALLVATLLVVWAIIRTRKDLFKLKMLLNVAISAMAIATVFHNHLVPVHFVSGRDRPRTSDEQGPLTQTSDRPDIYYLVFDSYTSAESLQRFWNYTNTPFVTALESRGFILASNAHANYDQTARCISSTLNMALLKQPPENLSSFGRVNRLCESIDHATAPRKLQEIGYELINLSLFEVAGEKQFYSLELIDYSSLAQVMVRKSAFGPFAFYRDRCNTPKNNARVLDRVRALAREHPPEPRFIYAHVLLPHAPFYFDRNGPRARPSNHPTGTADEYLEQLIYTSGVITNLVAGILEHSRRPPIIVLQGDHGYRFTPGPEHELEGLMILNAYYLPGGKREWVYDGITPVNSFRMIFNHYFNAHYAYVPDRTFSRSMALSTEPLTARTP